MVSYTEPLFYTQNQYCQNKTRFIQWARPSELSLRRGGCHDAQHDVSSIESYWIHYGTTDNGRRNFGSALRAIGRLVAPIIELMTKRSRVQLAPQIGQKKPLTPASLRRSFANIKKIRHVAMSTLESSPVVNHSTKLFSIPRQVKIVPRMTQICGKCVLRNLPSSRYPPKRKY